MNRFFLETKPEPICIETVEGVTFTAMINVNKYGRLAISVPYFVDAELRTESIREVAKRILELIGD